MDMTVKPKCFVIMPIGDNEYNNALHYKKIYEQIFIPAIEDAGFDPERADDDKSCHQIRDKIIKDLTDAPMVLCDLSTRNANVLYELGIRHAFDKPVVLVQEVGTPKIFDISVINTINYRSTRTYDEVLEDRKNITEAIKATAGNEKSLMKFINIQAASFNNRDNMSQTEKDEFLLSTILNEVRNLRRQENWGDPYFKPKSRRFYNDNLIEPIVINSINDVSEYLRNVSNLSNTYLKKQDVLNGIFTNLEKIDDFLDLESFNNNDIELHLIKELKYKIDIIRDNILS